MDEKTGFLEESPRVKSITRLLTLIGILWTLTMGTWYVYKDTNPLEIAGFVSSMVVVFGGFKTAVGALSEKEK